MTTASEFRYLPARPRDLQWGLHVSGAGHARVPRSSGYPPDGHPELYDFTWSRGRSLPEYQIVYIAAGTGVFESDVTGTQRITAGTAFMLFPGVWHRYRPDRSAGWEEFWVGFTGDQIDHLVLNGFVSAERPIFRTGLQPRDTVVSRFDAILSALREMPPGFPHLIAAEVLGILATLLAARPDEPHQLILQGPRDVAALTDRIVSEALRVIWSGTHLQLTVADLSRRLRTTSRSLERRFHAALGHTVRDEILRCRLDRVRRLLADTDLSVGEIVSAAGFSSQDAMARAVLKATGMTPRTLRKSIRAARQATL